MVQSPVDVGGKAAIGSICAQMFIGLFGRTAGDTIEVIPIGACGTACALLDVCGDRLCGISQLPPMDQSAASVAEQRVDLIGYGASCLESAESGGHGAHTDLRSPNPRNRNSALLPISTPLD